MSDTSSGQKAQAVVEAPVRYDIIRIAPRLADNTIFKSKDMPGVQLQEGLKDYRNGVFIDAGGTRLTADTLKYLKDKDWNVEVNRSGRLVIKWKNDKTNEKVSYELIGVSFGVENGAWFISSGAIRTSWGEFKVMKGTRVWLQLTIISRDLKVEGNNVRLPGGYILKKGTVTIHDKNQITLIGSKESPTALATPRNAEYEVNGVVKYYYKDRKDRHFDPIFLNYNNTSYADGNNYIGESAGLKMISVRSVDNNVTAIRLFSGHKFDLLNLHGTGLKISNGRFLADIIEKDNIRVGERPPSLIININNRYFFSKKGRLEEKAFTAFETSFYRPIAKRELLANLPEIKNGSSATKLPAPLLKYLPIGTFISLLQDRNILVVRFAMDQIDPEYHYTGHIPPTIKSRHIPLMIRSFNRRSIKDYIYKYNPEREISYVRKRLFTILASSKDPLAAKRVRESLMDKKEDLDIRKAALEKLRETGRISDDTLIKLLKDRSEKNRLKLDILDRLYIHSSSEKKRPVPAGLIKLVQQIAEDSGDIGFLNNAIDTITRTLNYKQEDISGLVKLLKRFLLVGKGEKESSARGCALELLVQHNWISPDFLKKLIRDKRDILQIFAIEHLAKMDRTCYPFLMSLYKNEGAGIKNAIIYALSRYQYTQIIPILVGKLRGSKKDDELIMTLANFKFEALEPTVVEMMSSNDKHKWQLAISIIKSNGEFIRSLYKILKNEGLNPDAVSLALELIVENRFDIPRTKYDSLYNEMLKRLSDPRTRPNAARVIITLESNKDGTGMALDYRMGALRALGLFGRGEASRAGYDEVKSRVDRLLKRGEKVHSRHIPFLIQVKEEDLEKDLNGLKTEVGLRIANGEHCYRDPELIDYKQKYEDHVQDMTRVEVLKVRWLLDYFQDPSNRKKIWKMLIDDLNDKTTEHGGIVTIKGGGGTFEILVPEKRVGNGTYVRPPESCWKGLGALSNFHFHAITMNDEAAAGPSGDGRGFFGGHGDRSAAKRDRSDGVVITLMHNGSFNVDYYTPGNVVVDIGVFTPPAD